VPGLIPVDEVDRFCNQVGYDGFGNNGSVYDYYSDVSGGLLRYTSLVADYYTTKHPRDYYTDPQEARGEELTREALDALLATGVDLSGLTTDHEGYIQALNVFYAGPCVNNWAEGLWPYSSSMDPYGTRFGSFHDYQVTNLGDGPVLGVYCHENGHMICDYPDLYDKDDIGNGVGSYCLMGYFTSPTNPCQIGAYLKDVAGWTGDRIVASPGTTVTLTAGRNDFLVHDRSGTEYFIVENRQQEGRDAQLPDAGLTIWHVDRNGDNSAEQMTAESHYECSLEQADGRFDLEHDAGTGDPDDLFGGAAANRFGQNTVPDSRWWDGTASGLELAEISEPGPGMTLSVIPPGPDLGLRPSVIGTWPVVAVDWGPSGTAEPTYAFTFHPDGTWTTESNTGRWVQVDSTVLWTVDHLDLVYSGTVGERMLRGVMGYTALSLVTAQAGRFLALRGIPESSDGSAG
jgi:M6 family metalloprotease-like protein